MSNDGDRASQPSSPFPLPSSRRSSDLLTAQEACDLLGIAPATLYAYVSRGMLRSIEEGSGRRTRRYARADVELLRDRKEARRDPARIASQALHWGSPVLDSAITLVDNGQLFYRGEKVARLARASTVEEVAARIWNVPDEQQLFVPRFSLHPKLRAMLRDFPSERPALLFRRALTELELAEPALSLRSDAVARQGAAVLQTLTLLAARIDESGHPIAETLQRAWLPRKREALPLLSAALVLCADHELNISSFTARCIASAGSPLHAVLEGALSAVEGFRHGGASARVEAFLAEVEHASDVDSAIETRIRRGDAIPGFGHPLYPQGDPRATTILEMLREYAPPSRERGSWGDVLAAVRRLLGEEPTVDFALVALTRTLGLPTGTPLVLFSLGRTIGWIGHALEQYADASAIRPRARYVGKLPH